MTLFRKESDGIKSLLSLLSGVVGAGACVQDGVWRESTRDLQGVIVLASHRL